MTLKEWFYFFMAHYFKCFYQFCQWVSIVLQTSRWTALLTTQVKIIPYLLTPLLLSLMRKGPNLSRLQYVMEELLLFFPWVDRPFCAVSVSHLSYGMSNICITQNLAFLRKFRVNSLLYATFLWYQVTTISVIDVSLDVIWDVLSLNFHWWWWSHGPAPAPHFCPYMVWLFPFKARKTTCSPTPSSLFHFSLRQRF